MLEVLTNNKHVWLGHRVMGKVRPPFLLLCFSEAAFGPNWPSASRKEGEVHSQKEMALGIMPRS